MEQIIKMTPEELETKINEKVEEATKDFNEKYENAIKDAESKGYEKAEKELQLNKIPTSNTENTKFSLGKLALKVAKQHDGNSSHAHYSIKANAMKTQMLGNFNKNFSLSEFNEAGVFAESEVASGIFDYLYPKSIMYSMDIPVIPTSATEYKYRRNSSGVVAYWGDENTVIETSSTAFAEDTSYPKKLRVIFEVSNDALRHINPQTISYLENQFSVGFMNQMDTGLLNGTGVNGQPKGLINYVKSENEVSQSGTAYTNVDEDLNDVISKLENNNIDIMNGGWIMHPMVKRRYSLLRDGNGNLIYPELRESNPILMGYPVYTTTKVSAPSTDTSEVIFGDMSKFNIINYQDMILDFFANASWSDANGDIQSGVSKDMSVYRLIAKVDLALTYEDAVAKLTGVTIHQ